MFQAYYKAHKDQFPLISSLDKREFAFLSWRGHGMLRHLGYQGRDNLLKELMLNAPRHSYRSAAYYNIPNANSMDKKGFIDCDFVADIDADHIPTKCRGEHNYAICKSCNLHIKGDKPEKCPECESTKFNKIIWICDECLDVSKQQVFHFIDNFMTKDFAIPLDDMHILFSGHRGYHIHIQTDIFRSLDQDARREITDYVTGEGFSFNTWRFKKVQNVMQGFHVDQPGWPGKIAREFQMVLNGGENRIRQVFKDQPNPLIKLLVEERKFVLNALERKRKSWQIKRFTAKNWEKVFYTLRDRIKADIDVVVSIDLHRLIRLEGSLHGKSGFRVMSVDYDDLKDYNPFNDACAFPYIAENTIKVKISTPICPKISINDIDYGPFEYGEKVTLPINVAMFLLCKEVATIDVSRN
jgi:DNA primase small subunit